MTRSVGAVDAYGVEMHHNGLELESPSGFLDLRRLHYTFPQF